MNHESGNCGANRNSGGDSGSVRIAISKATLQLLRTTRGWKLEDVIWEDGGSLLELLNDHIEALRLSDNEAEESRA